MENKSKIKEQPLYLGHRERLRTRFLKDNGSSMPDYEILELLLTYAVLRRDVKEDAKRLLAHFGSFSGVICAPVEQLINFGLTQNSAVLFKVLVESFKRISYARLKSADAPVYVNPDYLIDYCKASVMNAEVEECHLLLFDAGLHIIRDVLMQRGTINSVQIYVREIVKETLNSKACSVVIYHNHPSGNCQPSKEDLEMTKQIIEALKTVDVKVEDHLIVSQNNYYSFRERNLLSYM